MEISHVKSDGCMVGGLLAALDAEACRAWGLRRLHPAGPVCPACGVALVGRTVETWRNDGRVRCSCGRWYCNRTGTVMEGKSLTWSQFFAVALGFSLRLTPGQIAAMVGISDDSVRRWRSRLMGDK